LAYCTGIFLCPRSTNTTAARDYHDDNQTSSSNNVIVLYQLVYMTLMAWNRPRRCRRNDQADAVADAPLVICSPTHMMTRCGRQGDHDHEAEAPSRVQHELPAALLSRAMAVMKD